MKIIQDKNYERRTSVKSVHRSCLFALLLDELTKGIHKDTKGGTLGYDVSFDG